MTKSKANSRSSPSLFSKFTSLLNSCDVTASQIFAPAIGSPCGVSTGPEYDSGSVEVSRLTSGESLPSEVSSTDFWVSCPLNRPHQHPRLLQTHHRLGKKGVGSRFPKRLPTPFFFTGCAAAGLNSWHVERREAR